MENKFTEQDLQDYAAGNYSGNMEAIHEYLDNNPIALLQVKEYQDMYLVLKTGPPSLSFNLADAVVERVKQRQLQTRPVYSLLTYIVSIVGIATIIICWKYFDLGVGLSALFDSSLLLISSLVMIIFLGGFYFIEAKQFQKKFMA